MTSRKDWMLWIPWLALCLALLPACNRGFYLTESEVAALHANVREESRANDLLSGFEDKLVTLTFRTVAGRPEIAGSNVLQTLREIPNLFVLEQLFRQIQLDRLSAQIEESLEGWIANSVGLLERGANGRIAIRPLNEASVRILSAPRVSYDTSRQVISLSTVVRLSIVGTIHVRGLGGVLNWISGDADYPVTIIFDNMVVNGDFRVGPGPTGGSRVSARFRPQPGTVTVLGNLPGSLRDGISAVSRQKFGVPVHETYSLAFDYFAISNLHLTGDGELDLRYRSQPEYNEPIVHVVAAGDDRKLHHSVRRSGTWSSFREIPFVGSHAFPVALADSGPGRLELLTVSGAAEFSYASWREGRWQDLHTSRLGRPYGPFDGFKPAMVATAPGQIEAVLRGTDGRLHHLRRLNGMWRDPVPVPYLESSVRQFPLFHPVMVQSGNKIVLVFVDNTSRPYVSLYDLETGYWNSPVELSGPGLYYSPALASCGDGLVDLVYVAPDHTVFHRRLEIPAGNITAATGLGIGTGTLMDLGGNLTTPPSIACSGSGQIQLVGRGPNNRMMHNQYRSHQTSGAGWIHERQVTTGWQGWQEAGTQFFGSLFSIGIDGLPVGIAASRDGKVYVVSRQRASSRNLLYNEFDASRYAKAPWKAVHWRGFERLEDRSFTGSQAIAITDRQMHLVSRNRAGGVIHGALADTHGVRFQDIPDSLHPLHHDAVVLSSGPGMVDFLFPGLDGRINHVRWINGSFTRRHTLAPPGTARVDSPVTAVSFGAGQIEVAAVATNRTLYHWRYIDSAWTSPMTVGDNIISLPALVRNGGGMELLAVGIDQRVHRWRFAGAQWRSFGALGTGFAASATRFGPTAVSSYGDGTIDLAMVEESTGEVYHYRLFGTDQPPSPSRWFDIVPRQAIRIGGQTSDVPVLVALGPDHLHLLTRGADGRIYASRTRAGADQRPFLRRLFVDTWASGFRWDAFEPVDSMQPLLIGPAVALGDGGLLVGAVHHPGGRIYLSRYTGHRWSMFLPLVGMTQDNLQTPPLTKPGVVSH